MSGSDDLHALVRRVQNGDLRAFDELYTRFLTPIYRYVYFRVKRKEDAQDITQTVFLKAFQSLSSFTNRGVSPLAYFYSIARNAVIDHWRKKGEMLFGDMGDGMFDIPDSSSSDGSEQRILEKMWADEIVQEGMGVLTPLEAEALTLKFMHDMPNKEIAFLLEKSEEAIRQLQSRGIRKMRGTTKVNR